MTGQTRAGLSGEEREGTLAEVLQAHRVEMLGPWTAKCHACDGWTEGTIWEHHGALAREYLATADLAAQVARVEALIRADRIYVATTLLREALAPVLHTRTQTDLGPDFCNECSQAAQEWVGWPCPPVAALSPAQPDTGRGGD